MKSWCAGDPDFKEFKWLHRAAKNVALSYGCDKIYFEFKDNMIIIHKMYIGGDGKPYKEAQPTSFMIADLKRMSKLTEEYCRECGVLNT